MATRQPVRARFSLEGASVDRENGRQTKVPLTLIDWSMSAPATMR